MTDRIWTEPSWGGWWIDPRGDEGGPLLRHYDLRGDGAGGEHVISLFTYCRTRGQMLTLIAQMLDMADNEVVGGLCRCLDEVFYPRMSRHLGHEPWRLSDRGITRRVDDLCNGRADWAGLDP
jgi:hypothetical protein